MFKEGQQVVWATWINKEPHYYLMTITGEAEDVVMVGSLWFDKELGVEVDVPTGVRQNTIFEPDEHTLTLVQITEMNYLRSKLSRMIATSPIPMPQIRAICEVLEGNAALLTINWREVPKGYTALRFNGKDWFATGPGHDMIGNPRENKGVAHQFWFQPLSGEPQTWERPQ